jgi:hypothetical protein
MIIANVIVLPSNHTVPRHRNPVGNLHISSHDAVGHTRDDRQNERRWHGFLLWYELRLLIFPEIQKFVEVCGASLLTGAVGTLVSHTEDIGRTEHTKVSSTDGP